MPLPLPTMPTIEPLPRSKSERLSGTGPSIVARFRHIARQLVPNPRFVWKWCAAGAFGSAAVTALGIVIGASVMDGDNDRARKYRTERTAEIKRKADLEDKRKKDEADAEAEHKRDDEAFALLTSRAVANWETWRSQFTTDADGIACAHGSNKDHTNYEISCQVGPKGKLPTNRVVCNQGSCNTPTPVPEKK